MTTKATPEDHDWLTRHITQMIDEGEEAGPDENLILYGLDSIRVMEFAGRLREHGITVSFEELITNPTVNAWWALIQSRHTHKLATCPMALDSAT